LYSNTDISLDTLSPGARSLVVRAIGSCSNAGEDAAAFYVKPQPMSSFTIKNMLIHWQGYDFGIGVDTEPAEAKVTFEIPLLPI